MNWFAPTPVGTPQLVAFGAVVIVGATALVTNVARNRQFGDAATKSGQATVGIALQGVGFFAAAWGRVDNVLPSTAPLALASTAAVLVLGFGAVALFVAAVRSMGKNWSVVARTRSDHELVRTGPFAVVRHPIYLALLLYFLSFGIALGHWRQLVVAAPVYVIGTIIRIRSEERLLRAQFGDQHLRYTSEVPAFIPFLR